MSRKSFSDLVDLMKTLRAPGGCPWDRQQTYQDLKPYVIEEAYEVVEAIDRDDRDSLKEEIGDLLMEAVFLAEIARQEGAFGIEDSITAVHDKLVRRHPHVFADVKADSAEAVVTNWERLKSAERKKEDKSVLSGVPRALPALLKATRLTEKAARVGFDWRSTEDIFEKLSEETEELKEAIRNADQKEIEHELGDLLFTIANVARRLKVNAEEALQSSNRKFARRFEAVERELRSQDRSFDDATLEEMDAIWEKAKGGEY